MQRPAGDGRNSRMRRASRVMVSCKKALNDKGALERAWEDSVDLGSFEEVGESWGGLKEVSSMQCCGLHSPLPLSL